MENFQICTHFLSEVTTLVEPSWLSKFKVSTMVGVWFQTGGTVLRPSQVQHGRNSCGGLEERLKPITVRVPSFTTFASA